MTSVQNWKSRSAATSASAAAFGTRRSTAPSARCPSSIRRFTPSRKRTKPLAPASTTPALFSTASSSGVRCSAASARSTRRAMNTRMSRSASARPASSAVSRATVRMVPSTGSSSDPCRRSKPRRTAAARSRAPARSRSPRPSRNPSRNCDSIIPELPRAPRTLASAMAAVTWGSGAASPRPRSAWATDRSVRQRLVPVSPSGTG
jgi:hypothetical protein